MLARFSASHGPGLGLGRRRRRRCPLARAARARPGRAAARPGRLDRCGARRPGRGALSGTSRAAASRTRAPAAPPRRLRRGSRSAMQTAQRPSSPVSSSAGVEPARSPRCSPRRRTAASAARAPWRSSSGLLRLAALDREVARLVLPAVARDVASAPALDRVAPFAGRPLDDHPVADLARDIGGSLAAFELEHETGPTGDASLLGVAEALAFLQAAGLERRRPGPRRTQAGSLRTRTPGAAIRRDRIRSPPPISSRAPRTRASRLRAPRSSSRPPTRRSSSACPRRSPASRV